MSFESRRIFKSAVTSQNLIRELLQLMFLGDLIAPGAERVWLVSPWISNVVLIDNRSGGFDAVDPQWSGREIRLVELVIALMSRGSPLGVATSLDDHNEAFLRALVDASTEAGLDEKLTIVRRELLHTKGILMRGGLLTGSMNLTYSGLELNDETVVYDIGKKALAEARLNFEAYASENAV